MLTRLLLAAALLTACSSHRDEAPTPPRADDRASAWREDLQALARELPARHVHAFDAITEAVWRQQVTALEQRLPSLDDAHVRVGLARLVAALGDPHTQIDVIGPAPYPLALVWFEDGIFVIGSRSEDRWAVGRKVTGVGGRPIADVIAALTALVPHNNDPWLRAELPGWLRDPGVLAGLDLGTPEHATYSLTAADGSVRELEVRPNSKDDVELVPPTPLPLHLQGPSGRPRYWNKYVAGDRMIYFAYDACAEDPRVGPLAKFLTGTLAFADQHPVDRFVIDLRSNGGGSSQLLQPLIEGLAARPALAGRVFVIIGMHTFSSAVLNAISLKTDVHATLVGGPTGGKPSSYGEVKRFELPRSHVGVHYSTKRFEFPSLPGPSLEPDLPVHVTSQDWFSGRDPAIDAILAAPLPAR